MPTTRHGYYLAGSFERKPDVIAIRDRIRHGLPDWECRSRWLEREFDALTGSVPSIAWADAHDVLTAELMVLVQGPPWSPGKHTELGLAIAAGIPVYGVLDPWPDADSWQDEPGVFAALVPDPVTVDELIETGFADLETRRAIATRLADDLLVDPVLPRAWDPHVERRCLRVAARR